MITIVLLASVSLLLAGSGTAAAQGRISNAAIETRTAAAGAFEGELKVIASRGTAAWIGYRTPMIPGPRQMCCYDSIAAAGTCCGMCRLESGGGITMTQSRGLDARGSRIVLEPPGDVIVLARIESGRVTRLRTFTPDCDIDGSAMPIVWFDRVSPAESVAWLATLARSGGADGDRDNRVVGPAIAALALHPDRSALATLVALARDDPRRQSKRQALFWLAERAGQEAVAAIRSALDNDPDTEIKKRAVYALSRLPSGEGVPLLMQVARTHTIAEVRKQAMFWLGQSRDARAVAFFEEILLKTP